MIKYSRKENLALSIIFISLGVIFIIIHYFAVGFSLDGPGPLGILGIFGGVYMLIRYSKGGLLIAENSVVVDGYKIPASSIKEIVSEGKGWKITVKTWVNKDAVIYLGDYLVFTDKEKLKKIYKQLVALKEKSQGKPRLLKRQGKTSKKAKKEPRKIGARP